MRKIFTVVAALMLCATAAAQEFRSAISNVPGNEYPKVSNDMRAIVRYTSKTAKKVQVQGGDGFVAQPVDMVNDGQGSVGGIFQGYRQSLFLHGGEGGKHPIRQIIVGMGLLSHTDLDALKILSAQMLDNTLDSIVSASTSFFSNADIAWFQADIIINNHQFCFFIYFIIIY